MSEWLKERDWKSRGRGNLPRGFESLPLRWKGLVFNPSPKSDEACLVASRRGVSRAVSERNSYRRCSSLVVAFDLEVLNERLVELALVVPLASW